MLGAGRVVVVIHWVNDSVKTLISRKSSFTWRPESYQQRRDELENLFWEAHSSHWMMEPFTEWKLTRA
jgi:hypothetical protein